MARLLRNWLPACCLVIATALGTAHSAEAPDSASWIAADQTVLFVEVLQPEALIDRARSDDLANLFAAVPGLEAALRDNPKIGELRQVVEYLANILETRPEEGLRKLVGGGVVLAVENDEGQQRVSIFVTPTDSDFLAEAHTEVLELARLDAKDKGNPDPVKEADHRGVHGFSFEPNEAHAIVDGTLVIASGGDALKTLIDRMQDGLDAPLADDPTWNARREAAGEEAVAWSLVNLARLRVLDPDSYAPEKFDAGAVFVFGPWIEAVRTADWASLSLTWTEDRLAAELAMPQPEGGYSAGLAGYLPSDQGGAATPIEVPGVIASGTLWRDLEAIWEARGEIFPPEAQQGFAQLDSFAGQFFGGRDFGSGVLGALGTQWRVVVAGQDAAELDPQPELLLPAFAIVVDLTPEDPGFAVRLKAAFQSFIGLANLGAAETKAPPLMLGSEVVDGVSISTAKFLPPEDRPDDEPIHQRHNFSPSAFQVGDHFVISSSLGLARKLVTALQAPPEKAEATDATLVLSADGAALAELIHQNRERLVVQNMLEKGNDRGRAEGEVDLFKALVEYFGAGTVTAADTDDGLRINANFDLGR